MCSESRKLCFSVCIFSQLAALFFFRFFFSFRDAVFCVVLATINTLSFAVVNTSKSIIKSDNGSFIQCDQSKNICGKNKKRKENQTTTKRARDTKNEKKKIYFQKHFVLKTSSLRAERFHFLDIEFIDLHLVWVGLQNGLIIYPFFVTISSGFWILFSW